MQSLIHSRAPIGVFDSGIGGLSVLRALQRCMPSENFVYVADSGHAPYGEKGDNDILERCKSITHFLRHQRGCKAMVIACNTATAVGAEALRQTHVDWPIFGIEPAIKPAANLSRNQMVAVWATRATLISAKYRDLRQRVLNHKPRLAIHEVACNGLANAIEALGKCPHAPNDTLRQLIHKYVQALPVGTDTLVLGCTHYPLIAVEVAEILPPGIQLIDPGHRVAARTHDVLASAGLLLPDAEIQGQVELWSSETTPILAASFHHWLNSAHSTVQRLCI